MGKDYEKTLDSIFEGALFQKDVRNGSSERFAKATVRIMRMFLTLQSHADLSSPANRTSFFSRKTRRSN
jgi:hypothetical protein